MEEIMELLKSTSLERALSSKKKNNKYPITLAFLIIVLSIRVTLYFAAIKADLVEEIYSSKIYPLIGNFLSRITSIFPFSLGELLIILLPLIGFSLIVYIIIGQGLLKDKLSKIVHLLIRFFSLVYILFYLLWGFNYYREDYMTIAKWQDHNPTFEDLVDLTREVIMEINSIRIGLDENELGIFELKDDIKDLSLIALEGFKDYSVGSYRLDRIFSRPKPVFLSDYLSYTGITGIYFPFTAEANINTAVPHVTMLSTISHEIAHNKGFAKEDEANFIAYKANINNPDRRFQYSGYYLALSYLLNEVYNQDIDVYTLLFNDLAPEVRIDIENSRDFWNSRKGKTEEVMTRVNDNYLKSNNQDQGVQSYKGVVKLLLAEYLNEVRVNK